MILLLCSKLCVMLMLMPPLLLFSHCHGIDNTTGKTTFLDLLAGRKSVGVQDGEILLNGVPQTPEQLRERPGVYCVCATERMI